MSGPIVDGACSYCDLVGRTFSLSVERQVRPWMGKVKDWKVSTFVASLVSVHH